MASPPFRSSHIAQELNSDDNMPLKCFREHEPIFAFDVETESAWDDLRRENASERNLRLPCCDSGVTLRASKLGTKHFAHARRGACSTAPETAEHLLAKRIVVEGIRQAGWTPATEAPGDSPGLGAWVADVMAEKGTAKVAFEVQWSRQDDAETRHRQTRYQSAGVRGLWLFRQHDFPVEKSTPAFRLNFDEQNSRFRVSLPSPSYYPALMSVRDKNEERYWQQSIELSEFVMGALTGRLSFAPALGAAMPLEVFAAPATCWRCGKETNVVMSLVFAANRVFPGHPDIELTIHSFGDFLEDGAGAINALLPPALLKQHGVGALKLRHSKTEGRAYLSNGCVHCDALQGRFFEHELIWESEKLFETEGTFQSAWGTLMEDAEDSVFRWWFNERLDGPQDM